MNASPTESSLAARFAAAIASGMQSDAHLAWRGRHLRTRCMVEIGATQFLLQVESGRIVDCHSPLPLMSPWDFAIRGTARAWALLWQDPPPPGWHDLFALSKRGDVAAMMALVDDDMVERIAVRGTPEECAAELGRRFGGVAERVCCYFPGYDAPLEQVGALAGALRALP